jgi:hypothetical protein
LKNGSSDPQAVLMEAAAVAITLKGDFLAIFGDF